MRSLAAVACLAAALAAAGCEGVIDPSDNEITTISGTLAIDGQNIHEFRAERNGEFEVRITEMGPNQDAFLGLQYGPKQGNSCLGAYQTNVFAQLNRIGLGGGITSGTYCLLVFDVGSLSEPQTYTLRVAHP